MTIRIDRVYTKTGDAGDTSLVGGVRLAKNNPRIEAYGTVDELNASLGLCRAHLQEMQAPDVDARLIWDAALAQLQQDLFDLGADLATPVDILEQKTSKQGKPLEAKLKEVRIESLEKGMDFWQEKLPPLQSFVLPGGSLLPAQLHMARTICRRAERCVVTLEKTGERILGPALRYLNRLSDYLFVMSRFVSKELGEEETLWKY